MNCMSSKYCLQSADFTMLKGRRREDGFLPEEHELLLSAALPEEWQRHESAVVTLRAEADHQVEVHLEFCAAGQEEPLLSFH